ncbi:MAG: ABC transporter ATP-binding protein [Candidatus Scalindua sp. AMX11]|nr:MAG: ABC transporter ATP-binding protein [Candidatus Scalindua sp.]NOG83009.1 ABC transporter ATP-binding protein [Planctomycetota bacterium]RZV79589.1 MAG: ABC transporter ATP-binding protein [Candidatus Scalindua sp. SCAELEC01]TDE65231.1 MAG: ABC transporter ATP-binding protein [Candidatus Scalindua sp. AMX11]GJQ58533.1 MAG: ABC transporter ATP-binding protein [Candidatus Scalindua sp.]
MDKTLAIKTNNLTKVYRSFFGRKKVLALNKLNIEIKVGEIFGLLGPNGSGKTTTMKLLLGLIFPTEGNAFLLGKATNDIKTKSRIGFLPEESCFYRFLNADETLDFYGQLFNIPKKERKVRADSLIKLVGLEFARKRPLRQYSKGMLRRIGIAQALINDPDLIILDEPTSGLDPIGTKETKDIISELKKQGKTVLLCSHLLSDVQDICDRIAILDKGTLQVSGTIDNLLSHKDLVEMQLRNLSDETVEELKSFITERDGEIVSIRHPSNTLENLFLKIVQERRKSTDSVTHSQ